MRKECQEGFYLLELNGGNSPIKSLKKYLGFSLIDNASVQ
jgi:hypothetical protein